MVIHHQLCQDKAYQNLLKPHHNRRSWPLSTHSTDGRQGREVTCLVKELVTDVATRAARCPHHQATTRDVTLFPSMRTGAKPKNPWLILTPHVVRILEFYLFYLCLLWIFIAARSSLRREWATLLWCVGFLRWLLSLQSTGSKGCGLRTLVAAHGLSSCGPWGLVALRHVRSSQTRDRIHVPRIGRSILNHWTTTSKSPSCC